VDAKMHFCLVEKTQAIMDERNNDVCSLDEEKDCECFQSKHMDIWSDEQTTMMLHGRQLLDDWSPSENSKTRKIILQYH